MLTIHKIRADHVIDFAAEELKKYLRMMMPEAGDVAIDYAPEATEGFRLGLLEDFSLPCEAEDVALDDVVHIDTTENGGILAGSNPRSVLFAVYRFLRLNGCRWLYPGVDGEHVPICAIQPQKYHKMADHRFRGHCNEGAESQTCMLETIDFYAKQELNVYMIEFDIPFSYYNDYYNHLRNDANRNPEPVSFQQVLQWKRQCEAEIAKRGLQFHDMGHGWTAEPFGISSTLGWKKSSEDSLTEEQRNALALLGGKRGFRNGVPLNTNVCMSKPSVRTTMVKSIADYAEAHQNVTYLHVWLADGVRNHCECEECQKMRPSDFYMMIMNELDEELTARGLDTRIVFIAYVDTLFAPREVSIQNPERFSLLYAPIARSYCSSITPESRIPEPTEYVRNAWESPHSAEETAAFLKDWQKGWHGPSFSYEYHYWRHQYTDPGMMYISRRIYEDILSLKTLGLDGYVEDGSQRSFFPNGFAIYIYAEALTDRNCDYDKVAEDYFSHIYGPDWAEAKAYLDRVSAAFDYAYMEGEGSAALKIGKYYNPSLVQRFAAVAELAAEGRALAQKHLTMPTRPQTVSWRLIGLHAQYVEGLAEAMVYKCQGFDHRAAEAFAKLQLEFGKHEVAIERYFDHFLAFASLGRIFQAKSVIPLQTGM